MSIHIVGQALEIGASEIQFMDSYKFVVAEVCRRGAFSEMACLTPVFSATLVARHAGVQAQPIFVLGNWKGGCSPVWGGRPAVSHCAGYVGDFAAQRRRVSGAPGRPQEPRAPLLQLEGALRVPEVEADCHGESCSFSLAMNSLVMTLLSGLFSLNTSGRASGSSSGAPCERLRRCTPSPTFSTTCCWIARSSGRCRPPCTQSIPASTSLAWATCRPWPRSVREE